MKRTLATIIAAFIILTTVISVPVNAADKKSGDWLYYTWVYEDTGDTFSIITGYAGSGSSVTVPASLAGHPVLGLEEGTFENCDTVTDITLSEGITAIWDGAINHCTNLKSIHIPKSCTIVTGKSISICPALQNIYVADGNGTLFSESGVLYEILKSGVRLVEYSSGKTESSFIVPGNVTEIAEGAFDCSFDLGRITLPSKLISIGTNAFSSCVALKEVSIPASVQAIGNSPFSLCSSLAEISVADGNSEFCSVDGILYTKDMEWVIQYPAGNGESSFVAPNKVKYIAPEAFAGCDELTFVNLSSVKEIQHMAFWNCKNLKEVVISKELKLIGNDAFESCSSLDRVCYWGTQEDVAGLSTGDGNDPLLYANLVYLPIMGDVNLDLKINAKDVTALMKYIVGTAPRDFDKAAADFNGDGKVNAKDVTALMKYIVKGGK